MAGKTLGTEKKPARRRRRSYAGLQIRDVSRLSGVSTQTVSRYFNTPHKVSEKTRAKIAEAVEATGYIPNMVAKGLSSNRTNIVAAIVPTITHSIFADVLAGISRVLEEQNHRLLISESGYSLNREEALIRELMAQRPGGIVLIGQTRTDGARALLNRLTIPVVELLEIDAPPCDLGVGFSNFNACLEMTNRLIEAGYRKIGFICAPFEANDRATRRYQGYLQAMRDAGIEPAPGWLRTASFSYREGARVFGRLIDDHPELEVVFSNDILAVGGVLECQRRGLAIPADIGICGFDDLELASLTNPPLTTVQIPRYEIGRRAATLVLAANAGERPENTTVDVGFKIVSRGSTRPIRENGAT